MSEPNRAEIIEKIRASHGRVVAKARFDMESSLETLRLEMEFAMAEMSESQLAEMLKGADEHEKSQAGKN